MASSKNINSRRGHFWKVDEDGFLQNDADLRKIQPEFEQVVEDVKEAYLKNLSPLIHSYYLTGSIPRGIAVPGISDLDAFVVQKKGAKTDDQLNLSSNSKADLLKRHPEVTDIQIELWEWDDLFGIPKECLSEFQVILKLNSVCLYGEDLSSEILPIKPDVALANTEVIQLKTDIEEVLREIVKDSSPHNVQFWCKKIMKNLIRAGFYMVISKEKVFTRDLSLCGELFLKHYPEMREMKECLAYVDNPMLEVPELEHFLRYGFSSELRREAEKWLNKNNPERHEFLKRTL